MDFKRSFIKVFLANFISLISSIIISFIVPSILSIESYSNLKTYTFYISYITILHFGFIDGIYIKYGGKSIKEVNKNTLNNEHMSLLFIEIIVSLIILIISLFLRDIILFLFSISILPINMISFFKQFYQSVGEFGSFSKIVNIITMLTFLFNIIFGVVFKFDNYIAYCLITVIVNYIVFFYSEIKYYKEIKSNIKRFSFEIVENIKVGILILLGNFAVIFFYAIDRWFVKIFFGVSEFAYYSFAVSMLNIINTLVTAVSSVFYNYICKNRNNNIIKEAKRYLIIIGVLASCGYFLLSGIINIFLKKYIPSLNAIAISFSAYPYIVVINSLYINLYKINDDKKRYIKVVIMMTILSIIYNFGAILFLNSIQGIAFATTLTFITWYIYSLKDFKYLTPSAYETVYLIVITTSFLVLAQMDNWIIGGVMYLIIFLISTFMVYKKYILNSIKILQLIKRD